MQEENLEHQKGEAQKQDNHTTKLPFSIKKSNNHNKPRTEPKFKISTPQITE